MRVLAVTDAKRTTTRGLERFFFQLAHVFATHEVTLHSSDAMTIRRNYWILATLFSMIHIGFSSDYHASLSNQNFIRGYANNTH